MIQHGWNSTAYRSLLGSPQAAYHEPLTQPNALNLYAFILYEDDIETTSPPMANPKAFNAGKRFIGPTIERSPSPLSSSPSHHDVG